MIVLVFLTVFGVQGSLAQSPGFNQACKIINSLQCHDAVHEEVCGSNGVLYNSECQFAKAHCKDINLYVDPNACSKTTTSAVTNTTATTPSLSSNSSSSSNTSSPTTTVVSVTSPADNSSSPWTMDNITTTQQTMNITMGPNPNITMGPNTNVTMEPSTNFTMEPILNVTTEIYPNVTVGPTPSVTMEPSPNVTMEQNLNVTMTSYPNVTMETPLNSTQSDVSTTSPSENTTGNDLLTPMSTPTTPMTTILTIMPTQTTKPATQSTPRPTGELSTLCKIILANPCPAENSPVCVTGGVEYSSLCAYSQAKCYNSDLAVLHSGPCTVTTHQPTVEEMICNVIQSNPCNDDGAVLCGSDGVTYSNSCEYEKERCNNPQLAVVKPGTC